MEGEREKEVLRKSGEEEARRNTEGEREEKQELRASTDVQRKRGYE